MDYKDKIMEEFIRLFMQKSCKDIKVDEIAENLGISKRTIYETFSSKDEIIEQTLRHYQQLAQNKILEFCRDETDPLKRILMTCFFVLGNVEQINMKRLVSLKKHYPEIACELIQKQLSFFKQTLLPSYNEAQKQGYIFKEIEPEFLLALLMEGERDPRESTINFMGKEYKAIKLFAAHLFTIIRGVSTLKGVEVCDSFYKEILSEYILTK